MNKVFFGDCREFMGKEWDGGDIAHRIELWEEVRYSRKEWDILMEDCLCQI